jgi:hypothetical protein
MKQFPNLLMQRRITPAETFERGSTGCSPGCSSGCSSGWSQSNSPRIPRSQMQRHLRASRLADIREPAGAGSVSRQRRPSCRPCGRPFGRLAPRPKGRLPAALRRLRALRFADISTSPKGRCMSSVRRSDPFISELPLAPLALGAIAIASALAPQRFSAQPGRRRPGAAWCGALGGPLVACLAMARRGESCQQTRRGRGRAHSARVMAVHRKEADLDRFVAALLALACEPGGRGERRPGQPRARTGESSPAEQSCRRR